MSETIGFIGIGTMGRPMAGNLVAKGFSVTVYDADAERARAFAAETGARAAATLAALGEDATVVITMLPNGQIVREVMLAAGNGGLAPHLPAGALVIDMSSSDPIGTVELGTALREKGIGLVDAPVSGARTGAAEGTLTIMLGGDDAAHIARARPILEALGRRLFETGSLGSGHATKALNNYVAAANFMAASEAVIVGERFGLDPATLIDVINASTGRNFSTETTIKSEVLTEAFGSGFALGLLAKDVGIAADLAAGLQLDTPFLALSSRLWRGARDDLGDAEDFTKAVIQWRRRAG